MLLERNRFPQTQPTQMGQPGSHSPLWLPASSVGEFAPLHLCCHSPPQLLLVSPRAGVRELGGRGDHLFLCIQTLLCPTPVACQILPLGTLDFHKISLTYGYLLSSVLPRFPFSFSGIVEVEQARRLSGSIIPA